MPRVDVKQAGKLCRCSHDKKHLIPRASLRVVVKEPSGMGEKGYCVSCGRDMLDLAKRHIEELLGTLDDHRKSPDPIDASS